MDELRRSGWLTRPSASEVALTVSGAYSAPPPPSLAPPLHSNPLRSTAALANARA